MSLTAASFLLQAAPWISLDVRRGSVADISIPISAATEQGRDDLQQCLVWQFVLEEFDVGFQLLENGEVVQDLGRFKAIEDRDGGANGVAVSSPSSLQFEALEPTMGADSTTSSRGRYTPCVGTIRILWYGTSRCVIDS